jgi:hypothetical protein
VSTQWGKIKGLLIGYYRFKNPEVFQSITEAGNIIIQETVPEKMQALGGGK